MNRGNTMTTLLVASLAWGSPLTTAAQFSVCPRFAPIGTSVVIRSYHPFGLSTVAQPNPWPAAVSNAYDQTWHGWWDLNTANYCYWWGRGFVSNGYSAWEGVEIVERQPVAGRVGQSSIYVFPADQVAEADFRVGGPTMTQPAIAIQAFAYTSTCIGGATPAFTTETATFLHELGHAYGYGHFDGWPSMMNTSQTDTLSCAVAGATPGQTTSMAVLPDAQSTQCHDIVYGVPSGIDLSATAVVQQDGCILAAAPCAFRPGAGPLNPAPYAATATSATTAAQPVEFSQMNNLDAYTANPVTAVYFSRDAYIDAGDVRVFATTLPGNGNLRGEFHGRSFTFTFNPQTALPITGVPYRALVRVDDTNIIAETNENNNATDTRQWYQRGK